MVLVKLMGIADVLAAVSLFLLRWSIAEPLAYVCLAYLIFKAFKYFSNWASILDFISAITIGAALLGYYSIFTYLVVLWLLQKGVRSIF
jgi:hypothetical protein